VVLCRDENSARDPGVLGSGDSQANRCPVIRILVVEDEVIVGLALREELQDLGVRVVVQNDAESAMQNLAEADFDAAIIDVALPGMSGDAFARECRRLFPHMPIVLATGMHQHQIRALFDIDAKMEILEKPHEFNAVKACLEKLGISFQSEDAVRC
jgi:CheY-like chemotaxis protein